MFIKIMVGIVALLVVGIITVMILLVAKPDIFTKNKKSDGTVISADNNKSTDNPYKQQIIGDTKDFIPIVGLDDYSMDLGYHNYRAVIEVSSINYTLMSPVEQDTVDINYHRFLNSVNFPFEIYIQTRELDTETMIKNLEEQIKKNQRRFRSIINYSEAYLEEMKGITDFIGNTKTKKKYIIVTYNNTDLSDVSKLSDQEIKQFAIEELYTRCNIVCTGLSGCGLMAKVLSKSEIAECMYSYYHRNRYLVARDIVQGVYDSLIVKNEKPVGVNNRTNLDEILNFTENRIKTELITSECSASELAFYNYIYSTLEYFKQNDRSGFISDLMSEQKMCESGYADEYYQYIQENPDALSYTNYETPQEGITPHYFPDNG